MKLRHALVWATAFACVPAWAAGNQSVASLGAAAEHYLRANPPVPAARMVIAAEPLDSRLNLRACGAPLVASQSSNRVGGARTTVVVTCPDKGGWTVRVPVRIKMFLQVLVTTRPLARGDGLSAEDVHSEERDVATLGYGYVAALDQVEGRALARPILAGTVLAPGMLAGRVAVHTGDAVTMTASLDGIVVRADGIALGNGDNGARLRVRNANSGKVVDAIVRSQGAVDVIQ